MRISGTLNWLLDNGYWMIIEGVFEMDEVEFQVTAEPPSRATVDQAYEALVESKAKVKRRSIQMLVMAMVIYIACFSTWMMYNKGVLSPLYPMATLGAALGWMLGTQLHQIYTSQQRNRAIFFTGLIALILSTFALTKFGQEVALATAAGYFSVIVIRYFLDNRVVDVIGLNQQIHDLSYLDVSDPRIESELSRMRSISDTVDHYLNQLMQMDRPLVVAEYAMLDHCYQQQQGGSPLSSELPEVGERS